MQHENGNLKVVNGVGCIRVLHVDDDASLLEISNLMLEDLNSSLEIEHARCVDEGLKKLSVGSYDIVVSDFEMPQKDGLQFLKELRGRKNDVPFILFTGKSSGLGLYLVRKMMDVYGWTITEEGEPGKGARFAMAIPKLNRNGEANYQVAQ